MEMNKILLIIKREYLTRVKKKSFIIMSLLTPFLMAMVMVVPMWLATRDVPAKVIVVTDESGLIQDKLENNSSVQFEYSSQTPFVLKNYIFDEGKYGLLEIPQIDLNNPKGIKLTTPSSPSLEITMGIEKQLKTIIEDHKLEISGIDKAKLDSIKTWVNVETNVINAEGKEEQSHTEVAYFVGYIGSFMIYILVFVYGIQTMRGVIEEKTNRIVEVILSSVKPFQLMAGKIIGIGAVGLTQFLLWSALTLIFYVGVGMYFNLDELSQMDPGAVAGMQNISAQKVQMANDIVGIIDSIPFGFLLGSFVFYFLGSYLFYGSIFAAIGSAVDSETDAQQFQLPVTLPLIFSMVVLVAVLRDPNSSLAIWLSIIPFTSPIIMMMRLPFLNGPTWDLYVSMGVMVASIIFMVWMAARIYKVGILTYGSKPTYKQLFKWIFAKS